MSVHMLLSSLPATLWCCLFAHCLAQVLTRWLSLHMLCCSSSQTDHACLFTQDSACSEGKCLVLHSALRLGWATAAVGQFKELVESSERDVQLQETLRKVLNFTAKGWEAARQHALRAVGTDNRMRIWYADKASMQVGLYSMKGLLWRRSMKHMHT